ncbi:unnamed protein product, partial [Dibothriocephalus latus]
MLGHDICQQTVADRLQLRSQNTTNRNQNVSRPHSFPPLFPIYLRAQGVRVSPITLATRNVRSFLHNPKNNRLEWRKALIARELAWFKVDIAAISETRFSDEGRVEEVGAGYTFFWRGRPKAERRDAGIAFGIR